MERKSHIIRSWNIFPLHTVCFKITNTFERASQEFFLMVCDSTGSETLLFHPGGWIPDTGFSSEGWQ